MGECSDATEPKLVKASKATPAIDRSAFPEGKVTCKVTQQMVLEVPVDGVPTPSTVWTSNDSEVSTGNGIKVVHHAGTAKLMFIPAIRAQSGTYTLKATNQVNTINNG